MSLSDLTALQRLALSLACVLAGDLLIFIFLGIKTMSVDVAVGGLLYAAALSVTIWICGLWIAIVAVPVAIQTNRWIAPLAGIHAMVAGLLIWKYRNQGAVLFPPRTLSDFWQVGLSQLFSALLYIFCLRRLAKPSEYCLEFTNAGRTKMTLNQRARLPLTNPFLPRIEHYRGLPFVCGDLPGTSVL